MSQQISIEDNQVIPVSFSQFISSNFVRSDSCRNIHDDNDDSFEIVEGDVTGDVTGDVDANSVDKFQIVRSCGCSFERTRKPRIFLNWKMISFELVEINIDVTKKAKPHIIAICEICSEFKKHLKMKSVFYYSNRINDQNKNIHPIEMFKKSLPKNEQTLTRECYFCQRSFSHVF